MASLAAHAITIETDDGTGNLVAYTNTAVGVDSGVFYLITDRFGLDGTKTIAGDTSRTVWYEGILVKDISSFSPSRSADFSETGEIASVSSFSFTIKNTSAFWQTLEANNVFLARCRVTYYYVTSSDGSTFTFNKMWTGVIDEQPFGETTYSIRCVDNSKDIFGTVPPASIDAAAFPLAPRESLGKQIPVAIGRLAYSPLQSVILQGQKVNLITVSGVDYAVCAATTYVAGTLTLTLYTKGKTFNANDSLLVGNSVVVIKGGASQARRILSNTATDATTETTAVILEQALDVSSPAFTGWASGTSQDIWYFNVIGFSNSLLASTKPIYSFLNNAIGLPALYTYDDAAKAYTDISEVKRLQSASNIEFTGYPGQKLLAKTVDISGNLDVYYPIVPDRIVLVSISGGTITPSSGSAVSAGSELPFLVDQDDTDYYQIAGTSAITVVLDVYFPASFIEKDFSALYLLFNASHRAVSLGAGVGQVQIDIKGKDIYQRVTSEVINNEVWFNGSSSDLTTSFTDLNSLPFSYFNEDGNDSDFYSRKDGYDVSGLIGDMKTSVAYNVVRMEISYANGSGGFTYENRLKEMGFVAKTAVSFNSEPVYATLRGETFGTEWRSPEAPGTARKTAADPIYLIGDALEHLVRNYDYSHPKWQASYAYKVGEKVRSTVDNGFVYICTVAGTSNSSEPTFPTTLEDTVADNTVTWKALDTLKIHCNSFDTLATQRSEWFVGRALVDKAPTVDYIRELARCGFFLVLTDAHGRVKVKAWRENTTALVALSATNILQGSISDITLTPMRKAYNDFLIRYDENPASGQFNKQMGITHVDEPEFPGINELVTRATTLPGFTIQVFHRPEGYYFLVTGITHGMNSGDYASLQGSTHGYDFEPRPVSIVSSVAFYVSGQFVATSPSTSGTLYRVTDTRLKWKAFAPGISNYSFASYLWSQAHQAYLVTKSVQKLPQEKGDCRWFIDPAATDPAGNSIWTDLSVGDNHPATFYLQNLVEWTPWQKKLVSVEVSHATARVSVASEGVTRYLEEGDPISFTDAKLTNSVALSGWVREVTPLPGEGGRPDRIRLGLILNPEESNTGNLIIETGSQPDTITESGSQADTYTEGA